ncbi:MAG: hypothetical protein ACREWG_06740 [Gammaproteobacteria bacterium]
MYRQRHRSLAAPSALGAFTARHAYQRFTLHSIEELTMRLFAIAALTLSLSATSVAAPVVYQAAGPTIGSIQGSVDEYRAALGDPNGNTPGPLPINGRREINWDGGGNNQNTAVAGNPFAGFQITRGALFTTPDGTGFVQAPPAADPALFPPGGLAGVFNNPTYGTIFSTFSPLRLFSAIGSKITDVHFFVPGGGDIPATTTGFGAVFTDVDQPDGSGPGKKRGNRRASTLIEYFGADGDRLFSSFVPASPGDGSLSFFGVVFDDARIARVRITSGNVAPGPDDDRKQDVVVMDDFVYGEPQPQPGIVER